MTILFLNLLLNYQMKEGIHKNLKFLQIMKKNCNHHNVGQICLKTFPTFSLIAQGNNIEYHFI